MRAKFISALLVILVLLITACGQKGPLYLPKGNASLGALVNTPV